MIPSAALAIWKRAKKDHIFRAWLNRHFQWRSDKTWRLRGTREKKTETQQLPAAPAVSLHLTTSQEKLSHTQSLRVLPERKFHCHPLCLTSAQGAAWGLSNCCGVGLSSKSHTGPLFSCQSWSQSQSKHRCPASCSCGDSGGSVGILQGGRLYFHTLWAKGIHLRFRPLTQKTTKKTLLPP